MHALSRTPPSAETRVESPQPAPAANRRQDALGNAAITEEVPKAEVVSETSTLDRMATEEVAKPPVIPSGKLGDVYRDHAAAIPGMDMKPSSEHKWAMEHFKKQYGENAERYEAVAKETGVPAKLIAALHYRESSMKFDTYLHQGDKLGKKAVNHPNNIPIFHNWEDGATHALNQKAGVRDALGMDENTTDPAALATYAERYNGLGYHNKGRQSPYVYSGTDVYKGGKYVRDGVYDSRVFDRQPGVMALMGSLEDKEGDLPEWANEQKPEDAWGPVMSGNHVVREGQRGPAISALQDKLTAAGFDTGTDGHYGKGTRQSVIDFQKAHGLDPDGVIGPATAAALEAAGKTPEAEADSGAEVAPEAAAVEAIEAAPVEATEDPWAAAIKGGAMLRKGGKGDSIRELQQRLIAAGHNISADGDFGRRTRAAVIAFQRNHGLTPDGVVGPATVAAIG